MSRLSTWLDEVRARHFRNPIGETEPASWARMSPESKVRFLSMRLALTLDERKTVERDFFVEALDDVIAAAKIVGALPLEPVSNQAWPRPPVSPLDRAKRTLQEDRARLLLLAFHEPRMLSDEEAARLIAEYENPQTERKV